MARSLTLIIREPYIHSRNQSRRLKVYDPPTMQFMQRTLPLLSTSNVGILYHDDYYNPGERMDKEARSQSALITQSQ